MNNQSDPTEATRRRMVGNINREPKTREQLQGAYGQVWDTVELQEDFDVLGFAAPFCVVRRKTDDQQGTIMFQHQPRFYFAFTPGGD